jgi:regulator of sigma E protease
MSPLFYLAAVPVFALLVLVHEFGHFITAKWAGIRVEEFGIGFPPRIFGVQRGETLYSINLLPIGGFVKMPGENGEVTDANGVVDPRAFASKSAGKRAIVLLAGVTMNLVLAVVLFTAAEAVGPVQYPSFVKDVQSGSPAQAAGIQAGDHVLAVDGHPIKYFSDLVNQVDTAVLAAPANAQTVPVVLLVQHPNASQPVTITVQARVHLTGDQGHLGVALDQSRAIHLSVPLWQAPLKGVEDIGTVTVATWQGINDVIRGLLPLRQAVAGPVGIVSTTGQAASDVSFLGWYPLLFLAGFLSLNLAIVNVLPIPALDGGRVLFVIIEILRRGKRISPEREGLVNLIGMAALLTLVLVVRINDISNIAGGH